MPADIIDLPGIFARRGLKIIPQPTEPEKVDTSTDPPDPPGMSDIGERIAKLEGAFDGVKMAIEGQRHAQVVSIALSTAFVGLLGAVGIAVSVYVLQRVDALPADFERMNATLSAAVTAAKQQPPQVIVVPAPQPPAKP